MPEPCLECLDCQLESLQVTSLAGWFQDNQTSYMVVQGSRKSLSRDRKWKLPVSEILGSDIGTALLLPYSVSHSDPRATWI